MSKAGARRQRRGEAPQRLQWLLDGHGFTRQGDKVLHQTGVTFAAGNVLHMERFIHGRRFRVWAKLRQRPALPPAVAQRALACAEGLDLGGSLSEALAERLLLVGRSLVLHSMLCSYFDLNVPTLSEVISLVRPDLDPDLLQRFLVINSAANQAKHFDLAQAVHDCGAEGRINKVAAEATTQHPVEDRQFCHAKDGPCADLCPPNGSEGTAETCCPIPKGLNSCEDAASKEPEAVDMSVPPKLFTAQPEESGPSIPEHVVRWVVMTANGDLAVERKMFEDWLDANT